MRVALLVFLAVFLSLNCYAQNPFEGHVFPVMSPRLSSDYGKRIHPLLKYSRMHKGVDLAAPSDSPIRAVKEGRVIFADNYKGYGKLIVVMHEGGFSTHYGHCKELVAHIGDTVKAGEIIAKVGSTGHSTGPHLHFEIRRDGKAVDPGRYISEIAAPGEG